MLHNAASHKSTTTENNSPKCNTIPAKGLFFNSGVMIGTSMSNLQTEPTAKILRIHLCSELYCRTPPSEMIFQRSLSFRSHKLLTDVLSLFCACPELRSINFF
ncbi:uncharacterized protein LOC124692655 [Lolium rigidum]|uniref:uncharacterized protein LOC124692655 n=1 Tax=Lolium rigidum TaxID=89674 RepID=UPI001F5D408B|nr:uncharacterized protein LOC124692655 [Lolium rigidum]